MPKIIPKISINDRDIEILSQIYNFRYLSTNHLAGMIAPLTDSAGQIKLDINGRPEQKYYPGLIEVNRQKGTPATNISARRSVLRRLKQLSDSNYIITIFQGLNKPYICALGQEGSRALAEHCGDPDMAQERWNEKAQRGENFRHHELMIADFMVCLILACRGRGDLKIIGQDKIIQRRTLAPSLPNSPLSWKVKGHRFVYSMVPDWAFGLRLTDSAAKQTEKYYFIEADCAGRMPIKRAGFHGSSIHKKILGFITSYQNKLIGRNFDFANFRALFITKGAERMKNMHRLNQQMHPQGRGYSFFKFGLSANYDLRQPETALSSIWTNGNQALGEQSDIIN